MLKPIYIVTGYMRSGTSMMMQCLTKGGLSPIVDEKREEMNNRHGDAYYKPNRHGFYELSMSDFRDLKFPTQYEGNLIKILRPGVAVMRPYAGGYHVVCMTRDKEEIRQSYEAFFGYPNRDSYFSQYDDFLDWVKEHLDNRKDVLSNHFFNYREVVENPLPHFSQLKKTGWPINTNLASSAIDKSQCRFRIENLTIGI